MIREIIDREKLARNKMQQIVKIPVKTPYKVPYVLTTSL